MALEACKRTQQKQRYDNTGMPGWGEELAHARRVRRDAGRLHRFGRGLRVQGQGLTIL
jgi:hypothetical protein